MARPRGFDEQQVLDAAGDAFWAKGFEATSTRDLVRLTGLTQPSLYNAFGDKRGLYRRALEHYLGKTLHDRIDRLESALPPGHAIAAFFGEIVERSLADEHHRGCMLVNAAVESTPEDEELQRAIVAELDQLKRFFQRCMTAGQASGEVPQVLPAEDAATQLLAVLLGVRVLARINPQRALLEGAVRPVLGMLGLPPLPGAGRAP
ncbi:TetR/AcrR family transcriptional regulator [Cupriavidus sp. 2TAF22]|uniref:TetR/AcrR family transcriptional regulator n=1 Tax=unclassified Cupriavidus TaxID=2640874 RepID=UPI003F93B48F